MPDRFNMPSVSAGFDARAGWVVSRLMVDLPELKLNHAGSIVGNLGGESGLEAINERHPLVRGSRGGFGWAQWTGDRRVRWEAWCEANALIPTDDEANYRWLIVELRSTHKHALDQLLKTESIEAGTETFEAYYERPRDLKAGLSDRIAFAKRAITAALGLAHVDHFADKTPSIVATFAPPVQKRRPPVSAGKMTGGAGIGLALSVTLCWVLSLYHVAVPEYVAGAWTLLFSVPGAILLHCLPWLKSELSNV